MSGLYVNPVSVSRPCVPVAPSTNVGKTVSFVLLFAEIVISVAVPPPPDVTRMEFDMKDKNIRLTIENTADDVEEIKDDIKRIEEKIDRLR